MLAANALLSQCGYLMVAVMGCIAWIRWSRIVLEPAWSGTQGDLDEQRRRARRCGDRGRHTSSGEVDSAVEQRLSITGRPNNSTSTLMLKHQGFKHGRVVAHDVVAPDSHARISGMQWSSQPRIASLACSTTRTCAAR